MLLYRARRNVFLPSRAAAGGSPGVRSELGGCTGDWVRCGSPWFWRGSSLLAVPVVEVRGGLRTPEQLQHPKNTPLGTVGAQWTPPKERWDPLQGGVTGVASGWPRGCRGRRVWGCAGGRVPQGCWWAGGRAGGSSPGPRPGEGSGCGAGGFGVRAAAPAGGWGELDVHVHTCASTFTCVHTCACLALPLVLAREEVTRRGGLGCSVGFCCTGLGPSR